MNKELIDRLADKVIELLKQQQALQVEASGRHVHLSRADMETLFGKGHKLMKRSDLSQPGQYACEERIAVAGPKGTIENVAVLGPLRPETQVEISATDARLLGIDAPVRMSGQTAGTPGATLTGPGGALEISRGVIIAKRHIHMTPQDAARLGLADGDEVDVTVPGERSATFHNVAVRISSSFTTCVHLDYDDANACGYAKGVTGFIRKKQAGEEKQAAWLAGDRGATGLPAGCLKKTAVVAEPGAAGPAASGTAAQNTGAVQNAGAPPADAASETVDLTSRKLIHERELLERCSARVGCVRISKKAIVTQLAADYLKKNKIAVVRTGEGDE